MFGNDVDVVDAFITVPSATVTSHVKVLYDSLHESFCKAVRSDLCSAEMSENRPVEKRNEKSRQRKENVYQDSENERKLPAKINSKNIFEDLSMDEIPEPVLHQCDFGIHEDVKNFGSILTPQNDHTKHMQEALHKNSAADSLILPKAKRSNTDIHLVPILVPILRATSDQTHQSARKQGKQPDASHGHQNRVIFHFPGSNPRAPRTDVDNAVPSRLLGQKSGSPIGLDLCDPPLSFGEVCIDLESSHESSCSRPTEEAGKDYHWDACSIPTSRSRFTSFWPMAWARCRRKDRNRTRGFGDWRIWQSRS
jgi:hypothetical protein